jgi:uncharacterized protein YjcR
MDKFFSTNVEVGKQFADAINMSGYSIKQIAKMTGKSEGVIKSWCSGTNLDGHRDILNVFYIVNFSPHRLLYIDLTDNVEEPSETINRQVESFNAAQRLENTNLKLAKKTRKKRLPQKDESKKIPLSELMKRIGETHEQDSFCNESSTTDLNNLEQSLED